MTISPLRCRALGVAFALVLGSGVFGAAGCKPKQTKKAPAPVASASGSAAVAAKTGPCVDYATKFCSKAGEQSQQCTSFKEATELMSDAACKEGLKGIETTYKKLAALRGECDKLIKSLCDSIGPTSKTCEMVKTQTAQFPPARCKMMLEHLPEILEDLKKMEAANKPLSNELQAALIQAPVPSFGPVDSKVKIVEFSDFECPYCANAAKVVHQIREKYGDKVHFVFRQYPLPGHPNARPAAQAALAANEQGKFWQFHDRLFENQRALTRDKLEGYAKESGLDVEKFKKSLDDKKLDEQVATDMKLGEQVQVQGTPTLFINGKQIDPLPQTPAEMDALIAQALKPGGR